MANTGLLRDWLWFWQNGGSGSAKNPTTVDKTSRLNLTVAQAKNNYRVNRNLLVGLADNIMIANDAIEFLTELGFNAPVLAFDWIMTRTAPLSSNYTIFVFFGGEFTRVNGVDCNYITAFRWELSSSSTPNYEHITSWGGSGCDAPVRALKIHKNYVYSQYSTATINSFCYHLHIGGDFTKFNSSEVGYFVSASLYEGTPKETHVGSRKCFNAPVYAIDVSRTDDYDIYIGGKFTTLWGSTQKYFVRLYPDDTYRGDNNFNGAIYAIKTIHGAQWEMLAFGGEFSGTDVHGKAFKNFVLTNLDGGDLNKVWTTGHNTTNYLNSWVVDGAVYAIGTFDSGTPYNADGSGERMRTSIIIGGEFSTINGDEYKNCAILGAFGYKNYINYNPSVYRLDTDGVVRAIHSSNTRVVHIGGSFKTVNFSAQHNSSLDRKMDANNFFTFYPNYAMKAEAELGLARSFNICTINERSQGLPEADIFCLGSFFVGSGKSGVGIGGYVPYTPNDEPIKNFSVCEITQNSNSDYYNMYMEQMPYFTSAFRNVDA